MSRPKLLTPRYKLRRRGPTWTLSWTDPESGRTVAVSTGQTEEAAAKIWRDQYLAGLAQPEPPPQPLIDDILDGYLKNRKGRVQAYKTLEYDAAALRRHIGNLQPHMLTRRMYITKREKEGVSDGTIRREVGTLRAALAWAAREQPPWIDKAPYVEMPPRPEPRDRWLTRDEVDRIIDAAAPHVRRFVTLAYHTAARTGAILELTWDQVDLEYGRIDYRQPGRARSKKRRTTVPLNQPVLTELRAARHADLQEARPPSHVVHYRGGPVLAIKKGFAAACERAGITNCSPHILRHTAATHMVMAGVPLAEVARFLGDTEAMVEKVYGKHHPDFLRRAADALAGDTRPRIVSETLSQK